MCDEQTKNKENLPKRSGRQRKPNGEVRRQTKQSKAKQSKAKQSKKGGGGGSCPSVHRRIYLIFHFFEPHSRERERERESTLLSTVTPRSNTQKNEQKKESHERERERESKPRQDESR